MPARMSVGTLDPVAEAIAALDRGDAVTARTLAQALITHKDPDVQKRASALLDQLKADPLTVGVLTFSAVLLAILAAVYIGGPQ